MEEFSFNLASEEVLEAATNFVENYSNFVENLPFDLQRSATRLREIDCTCREILSEIETMYETFVKEKDLNLTKKHNSILLKIQCLLGRCQELGDEKIAIVQQINELVESKKKGVEHSSHKFKAIFRPDQKNEYNGKRELNKLDHKGSKRPRRNRPHYEKPAKVKMTISDPIASPPYSRLSIGGLGNTQADIEKPHSSIAADNTTGSKTSHVPAKIKEEPNLNRRGEKFERKDTSPVSSTSSGSSVASPTTSVTQKLANSKINSAKVTLPSAKAVITSNNPNGSNKNLNSKGKKKKKKTLKPIEKPSDRSPSPQGDIPIDPDEPTYCLCNQVSFGQMIGCDNNKCPIEWFHFSCVGLTHKPKGKWYCRDCLRDRKREAKKDHR